jgi:hypothetical protein
VSGLSRHEVVKEELMASTANDRIADPSVRPSYRRELHRIGTVSPLQPSSALHIPEGHSDSFTFTWRSCGEQFAENLARLEFLFPAAAEPTTFFGVSSGAIGTASVVVGQVSLGLGGQT